MVDIPGSASDLDARPVVMIAAAVLAVLVVAALLGGVDFGAILRSDALFPTTLAAFVLAMVAIDMYKRRQ